MSCGEEYNVYKRCLNRERERERDGNCGQMTGTTKLLLPFVPLAVSRYCIVDCNSHDHAALPATVLIV